ncbi:DUF6602 domain-containing protein [Vibrio campbellii]|uniref:DUF6602 domain-containing protein n=1 Tax=Vibrio campbellii TaxID=680 RepID=UPI003857AC5D
MSENIIGKLLSSQIASFANEFSKEAYDLFYDSKSGKLIHPGEFGMHRESCIRSFLSTFLPDIYGVSQGFIIGQDGSVSHQCDLIVYHKNFTPYFHTAEGQRFFPIETVLAVGEVKSRVNGSILDDALEKLVKVKQMREKISDALVASCRSSLGVDKTFQPSIDVRDQLVTFIMCDNVDCSDAIVAERMKKAWHGSSAMHRVNMIASIKTGTYLYKNIDGLPWMYSVCAEQSELGIQLRKPIKEYSHIAVFVRYLTMAIEGVTVLYPELTHHLSNEMPCVAVDL